MDPIESVVKGVAGPLFGLVDSLFTSDEEREAAKLRLLEMEQRGELAQIAVNIQEAKSENLFKSGWRPFIGWTCGAALAYEFVGKPVLLFLINASALWFGGPVFDPSILPILDWAALMPVLLGMLGLGSLRTVEKIKGRSKS